MAKFGQGVEHGRPMHEPNWRFVISAKSTPAKPTRRSRSRAQVGIPDPGPPPTESVFPQQLARILREPFLTSADAADYRALLKVFADSIGPSDPFEWIWARELTEVTLDIRKLKSERARLFEHRSSVLYQPPGEEGSFRDAATRTYEALISMVPIDHLIDERTARRDKVLFDIERRRAALAVNLRNLVGLQESVRLGGPQGRLPPTGAGRQDDQ